LTPAPPSRLLTLSLHDALPISTKCVDGITANVDHARKLAESSPSIVTPLNRYIGYEAAAKIAKHAIAEGITIRQAVEDLGYVERSEEHTSELQSRFDLVCRLLL